MLALVTLLYPAVDFDFDYYLTKHMPMVSEKWGPLGLKSWSVIELDKSMGNCAQCNLTWESAEAWGKAAGGEVGALIMADLPNYTKGTPSVIVGKIVGTST